MAENKIVKRVSLKFLITSLITILTILFLASGVEASGGAYITTSGNDQTKVYSGEDYYTPDITDYPLTSKGTIHSIGFDTLYGSSKDLFEYHGEVPYAKHTESELKNYRYFIGSYLGKLQRKWSPNDTKLPEIKDCKDLHYLGLTYKPSSFSFFKILLGFLNVIYWVASSIVKLMITIKSFDVPTILTIIDNSGKLSDTLATLFAINPKTKQISPVLIIGIIAYLFGIISIAIGFIKGNKAMTFKTFLNEFGFLIGAACITAIYFSSNGALNYSKAGTKIMNSLSNFVTGGSSTTSVYTYDTGNANLDTAATQKALINKIYIDQMIQAQTGYPVSKLFIQDDGGNSDFASNQATQEALELTFGSGNGGLNAMQIDTSYNSTCKVNNLGYYIWASNSGTAISRNGVSTTRPFVKSGNSYYIRTDSNNRVLFTIDFLNNLAYGNTNNVISDNERAKVIKIFNNICKPSYASACGSILLVCVQNVCLAYALFSIEIFALIGQLIITLGAYAMVIMPTLLLIPKTRNFAKQLMFTYLFGFARYLVGSALFATVITIAVLLCEINTYGIIISGVLCILLGKFAPVLLKELNKVLSDSERGKGISQMSSVYRAFDRHTDKQTKKKKDIKNRKRFAADGSTYDRGDLIDRGLKVKDKVKGFKTRNVINDEDISIDNADISFNKGYDETYQETTVETKTTNIGRSKYDKNINNVETTTTTSSTVSDDNKSYQTSGKNKGPKTHKGKEKIRNKRGGTKVETVTTSTLTKTNHVASDTKIDNMQQTTENIEEMQKAKKQAKRDAHVKNIKVAMLSKVNLKAGQKLMEHYEQEYKDKEELKKVMASEAAQKINALKDGETYNFNLESEVANAKKFMLNNASSGSQKSKGKAIDKASKLSKKDVLDIQKNIANQTNIKTLNLNLKYNNNNEETNTDNDTNNKPGGTTEW